MSKVKNLTTAKSPKWAICLICGKTHPKIVIPGEAFQYAAANFVRCPLCNLLWIHPMPDQAQILTFYPQEYYGINNKKFSNLMEKCIQLIRKQRVRKAIQTSPWTRDLKKVLDIGCGSGAMLKNFQNFGFTGYGTELSPFSAKMASSIAGVKVISKPLCECGFPDNFFNLVILWHVLEHLPDPQKNLQEIYRILKPGGNLLLCVPNRESFQAQLSKNKWFHLDLPRHLFHFSPFNLSALLVGLGFKINQLDTFSLEQGPFGLLQSLLNIVGFPQDMLYQTLHRTWGKQKISFFPRLFQLEFFFLSLPLMSSLSYLFSLFGKGGVIEIQAQKPKSLEYPQ